MKNTSFIGLASYTEKDAAIFKGRSQAIDDILSMLKRNDIVVLHSESGEGKSSLISAGLLPKLKSAGFIPVPIVITDKLFESKSPDFNKLLCDSIAEAINPYNKQKLKDDKVKGEKLTSIKALIDYSSDHKDLPLRVVASSNDEMLNTLDRNLQLYNNTWWLLRNYSFDFYGIPLKPIIIFDQFEEVITRPINPEWTDSFFRWFSGLEENSCPARIVDRVRAKLPDKEKFPVISEQKNFKVLLAMRNEYIGDLDYWGVQRYFIPAIKNNRYNLKPLTIDEAWEVMSLLSNVPDGEKKKILSFITGRSVEELDKTERNLPIVSAMLLSIVATSISENDRAVDLLSGENLSNLVADYYVRTIERCGVPEKTQEAIENALVDSRGRRVRIKTTSSELEKADFADYRMALEKERLIKCAPVNGEDYVELVHDSLAKVVAERIRTRTEEWEKEKAELENRRISAEKEKQIAEMSMKRMISMILSVPFLIFAFLYLTHDVGAMIFNGIYNGGTEALKSFANLSSIILTVFCGSMAVNNAFSGWKKTFIYCGLTLLLAFGSIVLSAESFYKAYHIVMDTGNWMAFVCYYVLLGALVYGLIGSRKRNEALNLSVPMLCLTIMLTIVFFYCIFPVEGFNGYLKSESSAWGLFLIPIALLTVYIKPKFTKPYCVYLGVLLVLALDAWFIYPNPKLDVAIRFTALIVAIIALYKLLWIKKGKEKYRKFQWPLVINGEILAILVVLQLGYKPMLVAEDQLILNYADDSIKNLRNPWQPIMAKNSENKIGIRDSKTGNLIVDYGFAEWGNSVLVNDLEELILSKQWKGNDINPSIEVWMLIHEGKLLYKYSSQILEILYKTANSEQIGDSIKIREAKLYFEILKAAVMLSEGMSLNEKDAEWIRENYNRSVRETIEQLSMLRRDIRQLTPEDVLDIKHSIAKFLFISAALNHVANKDYEHFFAVINLYPFLYFSDIYIKYFSEMAFNISFPEQYKYIMPYCENVKLMDIKNPQSLSVNTLLLLAANEFSSYHDGEMPFVEDWLGFENENEWKTKAKINLVGVGHYYGPNNAFLHNYRAICGNVIMFMNKVDSQYFNDFFQLGKLLIFTGLRMGFRMPEEIEGFKELVEEASEFNNWTVRKLCLIDEAITQIIPKEYELSD